MRRTLRLSALAAMLASVGFAPALVACGSAEDPSGLGREAPAGSETETPVEQGPANPEDPQVILDQRKEDYGEALRTATLKLAGRLPTLAEIKGVADAGDAAAQKRAYEAQIDKLVDGQEFAEQMIRFWKDTFRAGNPGNALVNATPQNRTNKDAAPIFAARVTVEGRAYTELFTATAGVCASYDATAKTFGEGQCPNAVDNGQTAMAPPTAGVLADPGLMGQYFSNMAFRRTRFVQETFACQKFPAELSETPKPLGNATYTGKFEFNSIAGGTEARINFHDTSSVICANCHSTMNHITPLFTNFSERGGYTNASQVEVPIPGNPKARRVDYLPEAEGLAWRFGAPVTDIPSLGKAMAADPEVARCAVTRVWNYALSRGDVVGDLATVPKVIVDPLTQEFTAGGYKLKETFRKVFKAEDFVKF